MITRDRSQPPASAALLTCAQLVTILQLSDRAVRRIPADRLPWIKIGRCRRYRRSDVDRYIAGLTR